MNYRIAAFFTLLVAAMAAPVHLEQSQAYQGDMGWVDSDQLP